MNHVQDELDWLAANHDRFCEIRHTFHRHPEIAFEENWTSARLAEHLAALGCGISRKIGGTGFIATLPGGDGPGIGLRTDMDALPQIEETGLPFASENPGRMHACGHDGHMTLLIATASLLARGTPLPGPVHFICQPAEEVGRGALAMLDDGLFEVCRPARIFGYHNWPELPVGTVSARPGAIMAAYFNVGFTIDGKGGHAALPELSDDMYGAMAALITRMNERTRAELTGAPTAFAFTQNVGGLAPNIIPNHLEVSASFRFVDPAHGQQIETIATETAAEISARFGVTAKPVLRRIFDLTDNDPAATALVADVARAAERGLTWQDAPRPSMISEDFAAFIAAVPGCYFWIGAGLEAGALHNSRFNFNDRLLLNAPQLLADVLRKASAEVAGH
ncbi:M20 metallopeptidase family protein [Paenirhodobacter populi]|uniref:M20 metallopeptidase family protein n=1 Tax=Paenirhodobacter populi TaxID=2306993 RepID=UPI000FE320DB|nr:amidohydrolase [Sinirhodobacter populi]RWR07337.1 amidohydrolase [Sinirhodobacter populi]